MMSGDKEQHTL